MPRRPKQSPLLAPNQMLEQLRQGIKQQADRPNIYGYHPHAKQLIFHRSPKHTRLYIGGNRSGKTVGGGAEMVYWLTKRHPYRSIPLPEGPVRMRAVGVDFNYGVDMIMIPEIKRWLPPSFLKNGSWEDSYDNNHRLLTLTNDSFVEFRSYEQDLDKFAGTSRHGTWFDEEPPKHIYNECMARHVDTDGFTWLTMTPVEGMTWVHDDLYEKGKDGDNPNIDVIEIDTNENSHLTPEAIARFLMTLDPDERRARSRGEFVAFGGRVFKQFTITDHVIPAISNPAEVFKDWEWYVSVDHGYNNPSAFLWHAVSKDNKIITFKEHYQSEMTVKQHAERYWEITKELGREPDYIVGDPAMGQRSAITGVSILQEYADHGIYIAPANNDVKPGIDKMQEYLHVNDGGAPPQWQITDECFNLINEMKKLRWKTYTGRKLQFENNKREEIHKKDDHACDSARYFFTFMPDLTPDDNPSDADAMMDAITRHTSLVQAVPSVPVAGRVDSDSAFRVNVTNDIEWDYSFNDFF